MSGTWPAEAPERYFVGQEARVRVRFTREDGTALAEAQGVRILVRAPSGTVATYEGAAVSSDAPGEFYADHLVAERGTHWARGECSAPHRAVDEARFVGVPSRVVEEP